jgi:hypothetical protein
LAVGDFSAQKTLNASTWITWQPTGTNEFLILSYGGQASSILAMYDGVTTNQIMNKSASNVLMPNQANMKVISTNAMYTITFGTAAVAFGMVQVK